MRHILVLDAGGTISSAPDADGALSARTDALGGTIHGFAAALRVQPVYAGLSEEMSLAQASAVVEAALAGAADPNVAGVLVAHGTDTMEETAFLADLHWTSEKPVVFTGAQRAPSQPGFDGLTNLSDALRTVQDPAAARRGAMIVFGGLTLPARGAFKRHTAELQAFDHRLGGRLPERRPPPLPPGPLEPAVELIGFGLGARGRLIDLAVADGVRGVVLEALGRGNAGPDVIEAVGRACAAGVTVLAASRCPEGDVSPDYATGRRLEEAGAIFCQDLGPSQARVLLARQLAIHADGRAASRAVRAWLQA